MIKVLVVEGERSIRNTLKERLEYESYKVDVADTTDSAFSKCITGDYDVILYSLQTPGADVLGCIKKLKNNHLRAPIIVMSTVKSVDTVVEVMKMGAFDFIQKPIDLNKLLYSIHNALDAGKKEILEIPDKIVGVEPVLQKITSKQRSSGIQTAEMIGKSAEMTRLKKIIDKVATSDARVLIMGPNGTGKELVAHWIHNKSNRSKAPFVEVNCAAIPSELIESELFGHEKGAFTSAVRSRRGKFEQADGGTLFLDEIGDMSLAAQAKVLRSLQENRITRVGGDGDITVDVRIIAATNKNLREEIAKHNFREDLYHRLSVIVILVPPLKDRKDDIPLLVDYFLKLVCKEYNVPVKQIDKKALDMLMHMEWTGNIRELRNVVERLVIMSEDNITAEDVEMYAVGV